MSKLLINEEPLQVLPSLAVQIGLPEAIVLQQVHYWLRRSDPRFDGSLWVYNTYAQWAVQFPFWGEEAIRKIFKSLRDKGLILARPRASHAFDRVNEYTIDYERLDSLDPAKFTASSGRGSESDPAKFTASGGSVAPTEAVNSSGLIRRNLPPLCTETTTETTTEIREKRATRKPSASPSPPDGVPPQVWADWLKLRQAKKAPVTETVIASAQSEAIKAGMTLTDFLTEWCVRGCQGLKAEWLTNSQGARQQPPKRTRHTGFGEIDYTEGVGRDGSF